MQDSVALQWHLAIVDRTRPFRHLGQWTCASFPGRHVSRTAPVHILILLAVNKSLEESDLSVFL